MVGARGPLKLKLASHLSLVGADAVKGSAAADVPAMAPRKPAKVVADPELSVLWDEIVPQLDQAGLLAPSDAPAVELALRHFRAARDASDDLAKGQPTVWDEKNGRLMKNPAEVVFRSESLAFLEYCKQLGMTFVSRARTPSVKGAADGEPNPFAPPGT